MSCGLCACGANESFKTSVGPNEAGTHSPGCNVHSNYALYTVLLALQFLELQYWCAAYCSLCSTTSSSTPMPAGRALINASNSCGRRNLGYTVTPRLHRHSQVTLSLLVTLHCGNLYHGGDIWLPSPDNRLGIILPSLSHPAVTPPSPRHQR